MDRRLGCLTGGGLTAAVVTLVLLLGFYLLRGGAMFSPGKLNAQAAEETLGGVASHAETGGDCATCHTAPWSAERMVDRCLACHTSIAAELSEGQGLHAELRGQATSFGCRGCHPEHRGETAALTDIQPDAFPHAATGYSLDGHQTAASGEEFACGDCHVQSISEFTLATCIDCHRQVDAAYMEAHLADFGEGCLGCHDGVDRYSRAAFDHNALIFGLEGKHAEVRCGACHQGAITVSDLRRASSACVDCHADPAFHLRAFGAACQDCHTPHGWQPAAFNLAHTFPIDHGEAGPSACRTCHPDDVQSYTCYGCHEHTPAEIIDDHEGEVSGDITDCASCHPTGQKDEAEDRGEDRERRDDN